MNDSPKPVVQFSATFSLPQITPLGKQMAQQIEHIRLTFEEDPEAAFTPAELTEGHI